MIFPSEKSSQAENAVFLSNLVQNKRNEKRYTIPLANIQIYERNKLLYYTKFIHYRYIFSILLLRKWNGRNYSIHL